MNNIKIQQTQDPNTCTIQDFPPAPSDNYRYFNQPIEQIPGWDKDEPQILFHGKNAGLIWVNIECVPVVTCVEIADSSASGQSGGSSSCQCELTLTRKKLYVLKDAGAADPGCAANATQSLISYRFDEKLGAWIEY